MNDIYQQLLEEHGENRLCEYAAKNGDLPLLKWAREKNCYWDVFTYSIAAKNGHLNILIWARENGCPWSSTTTGMAAAGGQLSVLKWLRQNGCPWDEWTCASAAKGGHLDILVWLIKNGCPHHKTYRMNRLKYLNNLINFNINLNSILWLKERDIIQTTKEVEEWILNIKTSIAILDVATDVRELIKTFI